MRVELAANIVSVATFRRALAKHGTPDDETSVRVPRNVYLHAEGLKASHDILSALKPRTLEAVLFAYGALHELEREFEFHRTLAVHLDSGSPGKLAFVGGNADYAVLETTLRRRTSNLDVRMDAMGPLLVDAAEQLRIELLEFQNEGRLW